MRWSRTFVVLIAGAAMAFGACSSGPGAPVGGSEPSSPMGGTTAEESRDEDGSPAWAGPDFSVETFDGDTFELAAAAGRPVVINFWESW